MDFATWAYPWDVREEGPNAVADRLTGIGIEEINLATNYHAVQAFTPHNPRRNTFFARASSYFRPGDHYGRLEPVPNPQMDGDWVDELTDVLQGRIGLTSWTVGCHNSRLGLTHRDTTIETATGEDLVFGLCPSHPEVGAYLLNLVRDLAQRHSFDRIELETFDFFYGTGFGWHHQKIHARLGSLGKFLLGVCFCEHCRENATDCGVAVDDARRTVVRTLDRIVGNETPRDLVPERWLDAHPEIAAYVAVREDTLEELFASLSEAAGDAELGYYIGAPSPGREWMVGADLDRLADHVDYYCLPAYESSRTAVLSSYRTVEALTPDVPIHVGVLPGHPAVHEKATVVDIVEGLRAAGVPRVSFYNYGLLPDRSIEWIDPAVS